MNSAGVGPRVAALAELRVKLWECDSLLIDVRPHVSMGPELAEIKAVQAAISAAILALGKVHTPLVELYKNHQSDSVA